MRPGRVAQALDVGLDGDVGGDRGGRAARRVDDRRGLVDERAAPAADHDLRPGLGEADGERPAEAATPAGDQGAPPGEAQQVLDAHSTVSSCCAGAGARVGRRARRAGPAVVADGHASGSGGRLRIARRTRVAAWRVCARLSRSAERASPTFDRGEDRAVRIDRHVERVPRPVGQRDGAAGALPQLDDPACAVGPAAGLEQGTVELLVVRDERVAVAPAGRLVHQREVVADQAQAGVGQVAHAVARGQALERLADRVGLLDVLGRQLGDGRAVMRPERHQPLGLERPERLAHGHHAHPQPAGQLVEPERRPGRELARQDQAAQDPGRRFGHRLACRRDQVDVVERAARWEAHVDLVVPSIPGGPGSARPGGRGFRSGVARLYSDHISDHDGTRDCRPGGRREDRCRR